MAIPLGSRLGPYEIVAPLGSGGMGEVYRARDTKLNRDVAIKVLRPNLASDADGLARFGREAQLLASLNHPNIAHIHGLEDSDGIRALVMELVDGPTLADRIAQGAIPVEEALPIARQIAEALEAAHQQGIIHRDLKPGNIKVRADGTVKVLDFGLAKALDPAGASAADATISPTLSLHATQAGVILGTAAYMSPEQARGKVVDARTDIWAFGCVLFEMLSGKRAFRGDDVTDTIVAVVSKEPDWPALPPAASTMRPLVARCLRKDPKQRLQSIGDARIAIDELLGGGIGDVVAIGSTAATPRRVVAVALIAAVGSALMASVLTSSLTGPTAQAPPLPSRFELVSPANEPLAIEGADRNIAISPDGRYIAYRVGGTGASETQLMLRSIDRLDPRPLGTTNARQPFFSPDSQWVGFFEGQSLKKVSVAGGSPITIVPSMPIARGASWGDDNTVVVATQDRSAGLLGVPAGGGELTPLTGLDTDSSDVGHWFPSVLPGDRGVLFTIAAPNRADRAQVAVLDLRTKTRKTLFRGSQAEYLSTGHLLYALAGSLYVVPFDLERLEPRGEATPIVESVWMSPGGAANYSVSRGGTLVYTPALDAVPRSLVWVDRRGVEKSIDAPARAYAEARLSSDGTQIALTIREQDADIWIWDIARETLTRLTFDPGIDQRPLWTPDSRSIVYASERDGASLNLYKRAADGSGNVERLTQSAESQAPTFVLPDGSGIVGFEITPKTAADLLWFRRPGQPPETLIQTRFIEENAELSPNGRYLAYQSNDSGRFEIKVRPFPNINEGLWQVSTNGGTRPSWARNGREIFYLDPTNRLCATPVDASGPTFSSGNPARIFESSYAPPLNDPRTYDFSGNGDRFLMIKENTRSDGSAPRPRLVVVNNWFEELKAKLP
jgi:serine/threonine-protein kinase